MLYLDKYNGYLADVPDIVFVRCDGTVFAYDELSSASMTANRNQITITGGKGAFPLAYIDTDSTLEFTFESAQFDMEIFEMANSAETQAGDYGIYESKRFDVETGLKITVPYEVKEGSVKIRGLEEASAAAAGKFAVAITPATAQTAGKAEITFNDGDVSVGDTVRVAYQRRVVNGGKVSVKSTSTSAKGTLYADWNVYADGTNCKDAAIKGILHMVIYRCRVSALPGMNTSWKTASTLSLTFAAIDPKRADKKIYDMIYEPLDQDGNIVAKSDVATADVEWITA